MDKETFLNYIRATIAPEEIYGNNKFTFVESISDKANPKKVETYVRDMFKGKNIKHLDTQLDFSTSIHFQKGYKHANIISFEKNKHKYQITLYKRA